MARQAITWFLQTWCEASTSSGAVFCVPRVMQRTWGNLSKYITEFAVLNPEEIPGHLGYCSLIPVVVLHVAPHVRVLPPPRVESSTPAAKFPRWAKAHADHLRGMC